MHDRLPARASRLTRRDSQRKYRAILDAGIDLFLEKGFVQTTMDAVAEKASVSKRTVYGHFNNKEELFSAVVREMCGQGKVLPEEVITTSHGTPEAVLTELGAGALANFYAKDMIALFQTVVADSRQFPEIGKLFFEGPVTRSHVLIGKYLAEQVEAGTIKVKYPDIAAQQFLGLLKTDLHMRLLFSQKPRVTKALLHDIAARTAEVFLNGVGGRD
ncbi:MAG TPA: TetR/AcrR family transcriptional regulator [Beijerinckiaceae bacterium]|jgi:TetR/AcrR family transcriptional repressor of mexJK operon|nr:TetR/AcrR family transcriptional regulator [Beijerinckiaceae bacterium]